MTIGWFTCSIRVIWWSSKLGAVLHSTLDVKQISTGMFFARNKAQVTSSDSKRELGIDKERGWRAAYRRWKCRVRYDPLVSWTQSSRGSQPSRLFLRNAMPAWNPRLLLVGKHFSPLRIFPSPDRRLNLILWRYPDRLCVAPRKAGNLLRLPRVHTRCWWMAEISRRWQDTKSDKTWRRKWNNSQHHQLKDCLLYRLYDRFQTLLLCHLFAGSGSASKLEINTVFLHELPNDILGCYFYCLLAVNKFMRKLELLEAFCERVEFSKSSQVRIAGIGFLSKSNKFLQSRLTQAATEVRVKLLMKISWSWSFAHFQGYLRSLEGFW